MAAAHRQRPHAGRPPGLPHWLLWLVLSVLMPAYAIAAVIDPHATVVLTQDTADTHPDTAAPATDLSVDLTGEHSDGSDDAADHVADTVPPHTPDAAASPRLQWPSAPPRSRAPDTLLRPPSARM